MAGVIGFDEWLKLVNLEVEVRVGVNGSELTDWHSYDTWESGASVSEGADELLADDDLYCSIFD